MKRSVTIFALLSYYVCMVIVMNKKVKIWGDPCQLQSMSIATCIALSAKNNTALFGEMIVTNVNEDTILFFTIC